MPKAKPTTDAPAQTAMIYSGKQLSTPTPPFQASMWRQGAAHTDLPKYTEMLEQDYAAGQALRFASNLVISLLGDYEHDDGAVQEFVRQALRNMRGHWSATLHWLLKARVYGFALAEKVWGAARVEGRQSWVYDALLPILPESVMVKGIVIEQALAQPVEIVQWRQYGEYNAIHIPGEKVVHWAIDDKGDGYGTPLGKAMLPLYEAKKSTTGAWQVAAKYRGYPQIYEVVPGMRLQDEQGQEVNYQDVAAKTWAEVQSGGVILRPAPSGEWGDKGLPRVEVLQGAAFGDEFSAHIGWVDRAYDLALGIPALVQNESQFGTRAQSVVHTDVAKLGAMPLAEEFVESCLMCDIVRPLLDVNFGEQDDYGRFPVEMPFDEARFAEMLTALNTAGVMQMMVPWRTYEHLQKLVPDMLPLLDEAEFADVQEEGEPEPPVVVAPPVGEEAVPVPKETAE